MKSTPIKRSIVLIIYIHDYTFLFTENKVGVIQSFMFMSKEQTMVEWSMEPKNHSFTNDGKSKLAQLKA